MRTAFLILVLLHGSLHLLGFVRAFELLHVKNFTVSISRPMGILWSLGAVLFFIYVGLSFFSFAFDWIIGLLAVGISQSLILYYWRDAKFGTLPNVIILVVAVFGYGDYAFHKTMAEETNEILGKVKYPQQSVFREEELSGLPFPVQQWLRNSGVVGRERIIHGRVEQTALMKLKPDQEEWFPATALQYTTVDPPAFIWTVEMDMGNGLTLSGRDKFVNGKGAMTIKANGLINMVNAQGEKLDEGSIQRYLGEMVWFPSLAVSPHIRWEMLDDHSAKATMSYQGTHGSGTFFFNEAGDFIKFSTLRFQGNDPEARRYEWILTVDDYAVFDGIRIPSKMKATWKMEESAWTWLQLEIRKVTYNHIDE